jgi:trk system potassium uptake protein TrkA
MRIIIIGAGEVGAHLASQLTGENHDITLIEANAKKAQAVQDAMDIMVVRGNGASPSILKEAGIEQCDLFLAVTNKDEINILASLTASRFNVPFKIARVSNMDFYDLDNFLSSKNLGTDLLINPEFECALQVANLLKVPGATEYAEFAGGDVLLFGLTLGADAPCLNRSLQDLRQGIGDIKFLVCSITRGTKTLVPSGQTILQPEDQVYFIAHRQDLDEVYSFCGLTKTRIKRVMVLGGSRVANYLCHIFEKKNIRAILIEPNETRAEELAEELTNTLIINGDVKDLDLLTQEGLRDTDCFLALTPADEDNMLTGIFAKNQKVPHVITLLGKHEYMPVFKKIGVQISVSPRLEVTNTILKFVREGNITSAVTIQNNQTEIMEFQVNEDAVVRGKPLKEIKLPKDVLFAMVHREHTDFIPTGNTILQEGDHVVAMTLSKEHRKLERLFL